MYLISLLEISREVRIKKSIKLYEPEGTKQSVCGYFTHNEELALSALISFSYHSVINKDNLVKGNEKQAKKNKGKCYF